MPKRGDHEKGQGVLRKDGKAAEYLREEMERGLLERKGTRRESRGWGRGERREK